MRSLGWLDWAFILAYLLGALAVGLRVRDEAETDRESYFLAGRSLPWWWAGMSIAATTFAADTPLVLTGILAAKGVSGNWIWLAFIGGHAALVAVFAEGWSRSGVVTDAELVHLRYSGRPARALRWLRAGLAAVVVNCITMGWVLRAMTKIVRPFFHWDRWLPGVVAWLQVRWPDPSPLGSPSEAMTVVLLLGVVAFYSSLGGIRGVVLTDLLQLGVALAGSLYLAWAAWVAVGGQAGLQAGLVEHYGEAHTYLDLFPTPGAGWLGDAGVGAGTFALYLLVQSYAKISADGGGYVMQRLNSTPDPRQARGAAAVFLVIHYVLRLWPWIVVGLAALVLIPIGGEVAALGEGGAAVAADRELAYPVLMASLLPAGALGLMVTSLLAAFMSTIDTHLNWGASYVVNDVYLVLDPEAEPAAQIRVARASVLLFVVAAVGVCFQLDRLSKGWEWVGLLGVSMGTPTVLRWVWWRVNATAELTAALGGLGTALWLGGGLPYELRLLYVWLGGFVGMLAGVAFGPPTDPEVLAGFQAKVRPLGFWPGRSLAEGARGLAARGLRWAATVGGVVGLLRATHGLLLVGGGLGWLASGALAAGALAWGVWPLDEEDPA